MLTREFIRRSLYQQGAGYFNTTNCVYSPANTIDFRGLIGKYDYTNELGRLYKERAEAWLTPSEIFQPFYSRAIGRYIMSKLEDNQGDLRIFEIGGGNGTNALHVLNFFQERSPRLYERVKYTMVEISGPMAERQQALLNNYHDGKFEVVNTDFRTWDRGVVEEDCFVIALEVLDNLPHDKLARVKAGNENKPWWLYKADEKDKWFQTMVQESEDGRYVEKLEPLEDPLAIRTAENFLQDFPKLASKEPPKGISQRLSSWARNSLIKGREMDESSGSSKVYDCVFVPSGAQKFLDTLTCNFPNHKLIAADFDTLPPPEISTYELYRTRNEPGALIGCKNAPLVASKNEKGDTVDHYTYLVELGLADIFFQTDFSALKSVYNGMSQHQGDVVQSKDFLTEFGEYSYTATRSGYNPMLDDYYNTKFLLS